MVVTTVELIQNCTNSSNTANLEQTNPANQTEFSKLTANYSAQLYLGILLALASVLVINGSKMKYNTTILGV